MWDLSHLTPLALENEVLTTGLPGKSHKYLLLATFHRHVEDDVRENS